MAHTPGPWTIEEYGDDECPALVIHKDTESRVCFMATPGSHGDAAVITADAKPIAAAPDLLAALDRYVSAYPAFRIKPVGEPGSEKRAEQENLMALEDAARAAIIKATGA